MHIVYIIAYYDYVVKENAPRSAGRGGLDINETFSLVRVIPTFDEVAVTVISECSLESETIFGAVNIASFDDDADDGLFLAIGIFEVETDLDFGGMTGVAE